MITILQLLIYVTISTIMVLIATHLLKSINVIGDHITHWKAIDEPFYRRWFMVREIIPTTITILAGNTLLLYLIARILTRLAQTIQS